MAQPEQDQFLNIYDHTDMPDLPTVARGTETGTVAGPAIDSVSRYFFFKRLADKARSVIEPAMRETSQALQKRGCGSAILREIETMVDDKSHPAHISLVIFTETGKAAYNLSLYPHIAFVASAGKNTVWVRKKITDKHGVQEINAGEYEVNEITGELVEKYIQEFVAEVLAKDRVVSNP